MAEQEVIKHTKAVYKAWNNPHTGWYHKLKEIVFEILIIVFAISLSLWLHNRNEKNHNREEAHGFLEGVQADLINDTLQLHSDLATHERVKTGVAYFSRVANGEALNTDSLNRYSFLFFNTTRFNTNISRYEALKASGKLNIIDNKNLLNDIINYYQQTIPFVNMLNEAFNTYKTGSLGGYLDQHLVYNKNGSNNWEQVLGMTPVKNALLRADMVAEIIQEYRVAILQATKLLKDIQNQLKADS